MNSKHTKAPWRRQVSSESNLIVTGGDWSGSTWIASLPVLSNLNPEIEANARLIAAAPDLLEAAKACLETEFHNVDLSSPYALACKQMLQAAVDKAEK